MPQTISEKIISAHAGSPVYSGDIAVVNVDGVMATDATAPFAIQSFKRMGGENLWDPDRVAWIIDHASPAPNERVGNLHKLMRDFHTRLGGVFYDVGEGICHQLMVENSHVKPGELFVGADSHTPTYGAVNAFAVGVGSTDLAAVLLTGQIWLKVPETIKIVLSGVFSKGVVAKDVILYLIGKLGVGGATYKAVEFTGPIIPDLTLASRMTLSNMTAELGAKTGLVDPSGLDLSYDYQPTLPDADATYIETYEIDVSPIEPQIAAPHSPDQVRPVRDYSGQRVDQALIGSCTNARLEDLHIAAKILQGRQVHPDVRLIIAPASRRVFNAALKDGTVSALSEAGATFITSGCGPCVGTHQGIPGDGEVIISSTNRNFQGRMGNREASIYLGSPAVVAAAALTGAITDPAELLQGKEWDLQ